MLFLLIYDNNHTNNMFIYCMYDFNHYICIIRNEVITNKTIYDHGSKEG
nr:MAG TPA: hypothetical protein [Caudoviricetes sp.]